MCASNHQDPRPSARSAWSNLTQPGPLTWKAQRWIANMLARFRLRANCCGNAGEPGC
jgi:hypothetical protein